MQDTQSPAEPVKPAPRITPQRRLAIIRLLALLFVIGISIYVFSIREQASQLARYGYPGIFVLSILANATVLLPAPGILFVYAMGAVFHPFWVAIASGAGAAIGELSGYLAGFSGQAVIERAELYNKLILWMETHPLRRDFVIFLLAFVPNPFFDLAGISSGALKVPLWRFLLVCAIGKTLKMLLIAYAGAYSIEWLIQLW